MGLPAWTIQVSWGHRTTDPQHSTTTWYSWVLACTPSSKGSQWAWNPRCRIHWLLEWPWWLRNGRMVSPRDSPSVNKTYNPVSVDEYSYSNRWWPPSESVSGGVCTARPTPWRVFLMPYRLEPSSTKPLSRSSWYISSSSYQEEFNIGRYRVAKFLCYCAAIAIVTIFWPLE